MEALAKARQDDGFKAKLDASKRELVAKMKRSETLLAHARKVIAEQKAEKPTTIVAVNMQGVETRERV